MCRWIARSIQCNINECTKEICELQNHVMMGSNYDFEVDQQHSKWYVTVAKLLYHNLRCSQGCHQHSWVLSWLLPDLLYPSRSVTSATGASKGKCSSPVNSESLLPALPGTPEDNCISPVNSRIWPPMNSALTPSIDSQRVIVTGIHFANAHRTVSCDSLC